ncbi:hypothetical protein PUN28_001754 [Cardiocondyla obscurior]|uniref:Uncharacterized protein n=1 Tax=Cardiocondyla obscurior TaxID=286306 RepID=A0AAW2GR18_9HYME
MQKISFLFVLVFVDVKKKKVLKYKILKYKSRDIYFLENSWRASKREVQ